MTKRWKSALAAAMATMFSVGATSLTASAETPDGGLSVVTFDYVAKTETTSILDIDALRSENQDIISDLDFDEETLDEAYNPGLIEAGMGAMSGGNELNSIISPDDQVLVDPDVFPYSAVLCLRLGQDTNGDGVVDSWSRGTGYLEGYDVMATAGHCFWSSTNGWVEECQIYTRQDSPILGSTFYYPYSWTCSTEYTTNNNINYDWCAVKLQNDLGSSNGWFGKGCGGDMLNTTFTISGYPAVTSSKIGHQYKHSGMMNSSTDYRVYYSIDTEGGQSGSPIYDSDYISWGIHTHGGNSGSRITPDLYTILQNMYLEGASIYGS